MRKVAIVCNKSAGRGVVQSGVLSARSILWGRKQEFFFPRSREDLQDLCFKLAGMNYEAVILMGGDGTINHAVRKLTKTNKVPLYVFPSGTANDLAKELNLRADWNQVQGLLDESQTDRIDLIEVNGIPFTTVAGIGIGGQLTSEFNQHRNDSQVLKVLRRGLGKHVYTLMGMKTILQNQNYLHHVRIRCVGMDERFRTPAIFICNQSKVAGTLTVAPKISNNDNRFNVLIVTSTTRAKLLTGLAMMRAGLMSDDFIVFSSDHLFIQDLDGRDLMVFGDGETLLNANKLNFKIISKRLKVFRGVEE